MDIRKRLLPNASSLDAFPPDNMRKDAETMPRQQWGQPAYDVVD
jgi:hypothetical protein